LVKISPSQVDLLFDPEYKGPTFSEWGEALNEVPPEEPIHSIWSSKADLNIIGKYPKRKFILHFSDSATMDYAAELLGKPIPLNSVLMRTTVSCLNDPTTYDWRKFCSKPTEIPQKSLLLKLAADAIKSGVPTPLTPEITSCLILRGLSVGDVDILYRLRAGLNSKRYVRGTK
jgi:hypothetical protein